MTRKRSATFVAILVLLVFSGTTAILSIVKTYAQPGVEWEKTFGGPCNEFGMGVLQIIDDGYIVAGSTCSYGAGGDDVYLVKADFDGDLLWEKTFGGIWGDNSYSIQQTGDGGYIIAGSTWSYGVGHDDFYLVKTDAGGDLQWEKTFGGINDESGYSVQQTTDGGYIMAGEIRDLDSDLTDVYLVKTDSDGNLQWERTFGGSDNDWAESVRQTIDGGYIIAGSTCSYGVVGRSEFYLVKTDADGDLQWEKTFGGIFSAGASSVRQTTDDGYIIAGYTNFYGAISFDFYLVKTDADGDLQWEKTFGGERFDWAYAVQQTTDGGYILAGSTESRGAGYRDFYLVKTCADGDLQWERTFGGASTDVARSIQQTTDGGYIVSGSTHSFGAGMDDVYLIKLTPWATVCSVWTTDANGDPKVKFYPGETVYIHWEADGLVDMGVYAPDGETIEQEWMNLPNSGINLLVPTHGNGVYEIKCTGAESVYIAIGSFLLIPELPFYGSLLTLSAMLGALFIMRKRRIQ